MDYESQEDYIDKTLLKLRKKQAKCIHPSVRCSLCGLYEDRIKRQDRQRIAYLEFVLFGLGINIKKDPNYVKICMTECAGTEDMTVEEEERYLKFVELD